MRDELIAFLIRAKKSTYAANGPYSASSRPGSRDLRYGEGGYEYIDSYLGGDRFAGQEAVWQNGAAVWAMNYAGRTLDPGFSGDFLKAALTQVTGERPFRGPEEHTDGVFTYKCAVKGDFEWFYGYEEIFKGDTKVYECAFHGGLIE